MKKRSKKQMSKSYDDLLNEQLKDPEFLAQYLSSCIDSDTDEDFEILYSTISRALQVYGVTDAARNSGLTRDALYKAFTKHRNPTIKTLRKALHILDVDLAFVPRKANA